MKTALIFDLDGTLLDTLQDLADAVNHMLLSRGCPQRSLAEIRAFVGNGARVLVEKALPQGYGQVDAAFAQFKGYYDDHCRVKTAPYAGIPQALEALGRDYTLAIVSNKPHSAVQALCADFFPGIPAWGEGPDCPRKPAPDMVARAMAALGADRGVYIGDSEVDVLTARNAAMPCLSVLWGFRDGPALEQAGAEHFCASPRELPEAVAKLLDEADKMC